MITKKISTRPHGLLPVFLFGQAENFRKWELSSTESASWTPAPWPDGRPGVCANLSVNKRRSPSECTGLILYGKDMLRRDWRNMAALQFDVWAGQAGLLHVEIGSAGKAAVRTNISLRPGRNPCRIPRATLALLDLNQVDKIRLEVVNREQASLYCFSDLALRPRRVAVEREKIKKKAEFFSAYRFACLPDREQKTAARSRAALRRIFSKLEPRREGQDHSIRSAGLVEAAHALIAELSILIQRNRIFEAGRNKTLAALWTSSLEKVHRDRQLFSQLPRRNMTISAAQGEGEGAQLVLLSTHPLKNVRVFLKSDLTGTGGRLPATAVTIHPVGYVKCPPPPYAVPRTGWWPDPILAETATLDLEAGLWQAYWLDVQVPRDQRPGLYAGKVVIAAGGRELAVREFKVKVRNFRLPAGLPYPIVTALLHHCLEGYHPKTQAEQERWRLACYDLMLAHRINPDNIYRKTPPEPDEVRYKLERGAGAFNIMYVGGTDPRPILEQLKTYVPKYKKAGILDNAYLYGFDEVPPARHHEMIPVLQAIKRKYPHIPLMTTAYDLSLGADSGLDRYIDIWVPLTPEYERGAPAVDAARRRGKHVWWYICCVPKRPYANWLIEYPALDARLLMGFMPWQFKAEGFLYYSLALWEIFKKGKDGKWKATGVRRKYMSGAPLTNWAGQSWCDHNGDGTVIYPGKHGPLASTRLKNIRDGLEDYFYLALLAQAAASVKTRRRTMPAAWLTEAEALLKPDPTFIRSLTEFTPDYTRLERRRERIGDLLDLYYAV